MEPTAVSLPAIDSHIHFVHPERMNAVLTLMDAAHCERFNLVCIPEQDGSNHNPAALFFKRRHPERVYISGALDYRHVLTNLASAPAALAAQVRALKAAGFDGMKMIEGKPQVRRMIPHALDGPLYAGVWSALEQEDLPVVLHAADPHNFWDAQRCPEWARASGWDYSDGSYPSREELYAEVECILTRYPRLNMILAHFGFLADDLPRAARFLDANPGASFDLAPHMEMYQELSSRPNEAHAFFLRYQDRILYGTDIDTRVLARGGNGPAFMQSIPRLIRAFLEQRGPFGGTEQLPYHGLGLPPAVLEKIYCRNFERLFGASPAPLMDKEPNENQ